MYSLVEEMSTISDNQISGQMDAQPSGFLEGGILDAKSHYVILALALDGIWPVGHACAVLCWGDDLMSLGIKSSAFLRVFTMGSWIHDGFAVHILP